MLAAVTIQRNQEVVLFCANAKGHTVVKKGSNP